MTAAGVGQHGLNEGVPLAHRPLIVARLDHAQRVSTISRKASVHTVAAVGGCPLDGFLGLRDCIGIQADDPALHDVVAMGAAQITLR